MNAIIYKEKIISDVIDEMLSLAEDDENMGVSADDVLECKEILFDYIDALAALNEPRDDEIIAEVKAAVQALGELNESTGGLLIEAAEREAICEIIQEAAAECGFSDELSDVAEEIFEW